MMQEFLTNNTVNCNLMSLTGYRTLVILKALMESPKTNSELNDYLFENQYIKERFSNDTLRIYINSLRSIGCEIRPANKSSSKKYVLLSHPFHYDVPASQLRALYKIFKRICSNVDVAEMIALEDFFAKISALSKSESTKAFFKNISVLKNLNRSVLDDLLVHCKKKSQITFLYDSPKDGEKEIEIIADRLSFRLDNLYLWGDNLTHEQHSYFGVDRILKITNIKMFKDKKDFPPIKIIYELYNHNDNYILEADEKIKEKSKDKLVIEAISRNEFNLMQRVLHLAADCKVIYPDRFVKKLSDNLINMGKCYDDA